MNNKPIYDLMPWYVNGSLNEQQRKNIEQELANNPELAQEHDFLQELQSQVKQTQVGSPGEFWLHRLRRDISNQSLEKTTNKWRIFSVAASIVLVFQLGVIVNITQPNDIYTPLSDVGTDAGIGFSIGFDAGKTIIQIQFSSAATVLKINSFLLELDAVIVDGPSSAGVYRIQLEKINAKALKHLRDNPKLIEFFSEQ